MLCPEWPFSILADVFRVDREGEEKRFDSWANNNNRMLLWHGSRLTNYVRPHPRFVSDPLLLSDRHS